MLQLYGPTIGPGAQPGAALETYDFKAGSVSAEVLQAWIAKHVPLEPKPAVKRPVNYTKWVIASTIVLGILSFAKIAWSYVLPIMQNRNLWAAISLVLILLFTSGHMFNHIRKTPYVSGDGKGGISYFAGGFQNQFGLETQIVAAIYAVLSFATIALALRVPRILNPKTQAVATWVWVGVMFLTYGYLMSVFRKKNGGYPFWLPPFTN